MNEKVNIWTKLMSRAAVFFMLLSVLFSGCPGGMLLRAYAYEVDEMTCDPFRVVLSETEKTVRRVKAEIRIIPNKKSDEILSQYAVNYYWDSVKGGRDPHQGTEYTIDTPGEHILNIYVHKPNTAPLYGTITFNVDNIDNTAPKMGNIRSRLNKGKWEVTIEGCSDDKTAAENLRYICLNESQAASFKSGGAVNEGSIASASGWSGEKDFMLEEGSYSIFAMDEVGNVGERSFETGHIDTEPPFFKTEPELSYEGEINGFAKAVVISVDADDEGDGLCEYPYSFNGGETWQQGNQMRVVENGTVCILLKDSMGNTSEVKTVEITNIDNEAPSLKVSEGGGTSGDGIVEINVSAADERSGVTEISYQNDEVGIPVIIAGGDGSSSGSLQTSVTINSNGSYTFTAKDLMGNKSFERINVVRAIKTEYRDASKDKDSGKEKDRDKDRKDKDKDKNKNKDKNKSDKDTKIINPGNGSGGNGNSSGNSGNNGSEGEKKIIIRDSVSERPEADTKNSSAKTGISIKPGGTTGANGSMIVAGSKESTGSLNKELRAGSGKNDVAGSEDSSGESDEEDKDKCDTASTEIREVTLDEYLAAAPENEAVEEEVIPELVEKDEEKEGKKKSRAGVVAMVILILLVLTGLTLFLLVKKGIISLPEEPGEDNDESDEETGILGFADRIASCFKKGLT